MATLSSAVVLHELSRMVIAWALRLKVLLSIRPFPRWLLRVVIAEHVQIFNDVVAAVSLERQGTVSLIIQSSTAQVQNRIHLPAALPATLTHLLRRHSGQLLGWIVPISGVVSFCGKFSAAHAKRGVVAGAGCIEQAHVFMDSAVEPAEGVGGGREWTAVFTYCIINLIPKHQILINPPSLIHILEH